jgi:hypothetical protein
MHQIIHGAGNFFKGGIGVITVAEVQIHVIGTQPA